jgi:hypothetical protein
MVMKINEIPLEKLTINIIKERYWDPVKKVCKPIDVIYAQDLSESSNFSDISHATIIPTGALLVGSRRKEQVKINDYLSDGNGPYKDDDSNGKTFYYPELAEPDEFNNNSIQIGWRGRNGKANGEVNNYITFDALDCVDCWVLSGDASNL